jgi:hypothetical protein
MSFTTRVDRTAVWVGDLFHYLIIVDHPPEVEFVLENLNKDTLTMDPLRVTDVSYNSVAQKEGQRRLFVDVALTSYVVGQSQLQIPQITLFFFRKNSSMTGLEQAAAESLTVPGPVISLRSSLPPEPEELRDAVTVSGWASARWVIPATGWGALALLIAGGGWEAAMLIQRKRGRKGPDPRKAMAAIHERWSRSVPLDFSDSQAVVEFCGRSYHDLKEYLGYLLETPTDGLTSDEMREEMARKAANAVLTERSAKVLSTCELVRYGRNGTDVADVGSQLAHDMREIFQIAAQG